MSRAPTRADVRRLDDGERQALHAATLRALQRMPYLAVVLYNLRPVAVPGSGGVSVDRRWRLYIDPQVYGSWTPEQQANALLHEAGHLLRHHDARARAIGADDPQRWNIAADLGVNEDLVRPRGDAAALPPTSADLPETYGLRRGRTAEERYVHLDPRATAAEGSPSVAPAGEVGGAGAGGGARAPEPGADPAAGPAVGTGETPPGHVPACGSGAGGEPLPWELPDDVTAFDDQSPPERASGDDSGVAAAAEGGGPRGGEDDLAGVSEAEAELLRRETAQRIAEHDSGRGAVPQGLRRWAGGVLAPPQVDWRQQLAAAIRRAFSFVAGRVDYTYKRPSRRRIPGVILPSMHQPSPSVVTLIDTSASMRDTQLHAALSEVEGICRQGGVRGRSHRVLVVDAAVQGVQHVSRASDVVLRGGGGTDMRRGIAAALDLRPRPDVLIVLTDGMTPWPETVPSSVRVVVVLIPPPRRGARSRVVPPPAWATVVEVGTAA